MLQAIAESARETFAAAREDIESVRGQLAGVRARLVQSGGAIAEPPGLSTTGDPTVAGRLERGPRPDAATIRAAKLQVPGDVDHARARRDAQRTLDSIDFSRPDIALWVPATGSHSIPSNWRAAVDQAAPPGSTSLALVDYPASANFNDSVATGMETLRLVLAGIAERGGNHRVTLAGHSQGAWVIGDAIDTPQLARVVDRAVLYGHPSTARVDWARAGDPAVRQVDDPQDPFTRPLDGGRDALRAIDELHDGRPGGGAAPLDVGDMLGRVGHVARTALENPRLSAYLLAKYALPQDGPTPRDPHHYQARYAEGARFLAG